MNTLSSGKVTGETRRDLTGDYIARGTARTACLAVNVQKEIAIIYGNVEGPNRAFPDSQYETGGIDQPRRPSGSRDQHTPPACRSLPGRSSAATFRSGDCASGLASWGVTSW